MSMITEQIERMRRLADVMEKSTFVHEATHFIAIKVLREAANTIEQLATKVRENNAYQKAFKDIRAEIESVQINGQIDNHTAFIRSGEQVKNMALEIIDSYDPRRSRNEQY